MDQLRNLNIDFVFLVRLFDWFLFQLIVLLKPDFNCCNSFSLSWFDKSYDKNFVTSVLKERKQSSEQVKMRLILKIINDISRVLQKYFKYFNDFAILRSFVLPAAGMFPVTLICNLNDSDYIILSSL